MATTDDLIQDVYANFLNAYSHNTGSKNTVISFEAVGLSPALDPAVAGGKAAALEYLSNEADWLPDLTNGSYERTMRTISVSYANLINTSVPISESGGAIFNAMKASAVEALHNFDLGSMSGPSTFKPAYPAPQNWFDPAQTLGWSNYSYTAGKTVSLGPQPAIRPPVWRMMTNVPLTFSAATPASPVEAPARLVDGRPAVEHAIPTQTLAAGNSHVATLALEAPTIQRAPVRPAPVNQRMAIDSEVFHLSPLIVNNSGDKPVLQPSFSMSFQYCIVELNRPWYSGDLLANDQWYVPGQHAGDFATGSTAASTPSTTAPPLSPTTANSGFFAWVPVAFVAIKNLVIRSTGTALDLSVAKSVTSFGPFSLSPSTSTNELSNAGIEIIAWICSAQPQLPPRSDPALIPGPSTVSNSSTTTADKIVDILEGLLGTDRKP